MYLKLIFIIGFFVVSIIIRENEKIYDRRKKYEKREK